MFTVPHLSPCLVSEAASPAPSPGLGDRTGQMGPNYSPSGIDGAWGPGGAGLVREDTARQPGRAVGQPSRAGSQAGLGASRMRSPEAALWWPHPRECGLPRYHWLDAMGRGWMPGLWEGHQEGLLGYDSSGLVLELRSSEDGGGGRAGRELWGFVGVLSQKVSPGGPWGYQKPSGRRQCGWAAWGPVHRVPVWNLPRGGT